MVSWVGLGSISENKSQTTAQRSINLIVVYDFIIIYCLTSQCPQGFGFDFDFDSDAYART